jgi:hypothetical protein
MRHVVGLHRTSDQPLGKASTYAGKHNTDTKANIHASSGIRTHDPSKRGAKFYALNGAATGTSEMKE